MGWDKHCTWSFPFNSKLWKFLLEIKWNRPFMSGPTRIFATTIEGGPLWPVWSFHCPFPFDKIAVSTTPLLLPGAPRWPDNHNYAGNPRFYRFRTVWAPFNFSYSKASCENEITSSHECHSSFLFPWFWFFFFWRILHLHQQLMFIMSLSKMKLGNISYMYNVLTAVNDWLWQKNSSELQLICLV